MTRTAGRYAPERYTPDDPAYGYYVVAIGPTGNRWIASGWEYRSDAIDDKRDNGTFYGKAVLILTRTACEDRGIDPANPDSWIEG